MINDKTYTNVLLRIIQFLLRKNGYKVEYGHFSDIDPYFPNVTFLYPLKTSENLWFSDIFRGYINVTLGEYGLTL